MIMSVYSYMMHTTSIMTNPPISSLRDRYLEDSVGSYLTLRVMNAKLLGFLGCSPPLTYQQSMLQAKLEVPDHVRSTKSLDHRKAVPRLHRQRWDRRYCRYWVGFALSPAFVRFGWRVACSSRSADQQTFAARSSIRGE